ncbi:MAG: Tryptophanyl-tRNA synthetase, partial [uncultured Friedmanniella sp.]
AHLRPQRPAPRPLPRPADRGLPAPRQLPRGAAAVGAAAGLPRRVLRRGRPARADRRGRARGAGRPLAPQRRPDAGRRHRPGALDGVPAVRRARAHPADVGAVGDDGVRPGAADDPVQGQVGPVRRRGHQRRPVHLPRADGRGHPALPGRPGAGGGGPAPAPGADARPRRPLQLPPRADLRGPRAAHPALGRQDPGPRRPDREDEQELVLAQRHRRAARRAARERQEDQVGRHRLRPRGDLRRGGQARRRQPAHHPVGADRDVGGRARRGLRGPGLRRPQEGGRGGRHGVRDALPGAHPGADGGAHRAGGPAARRRRAGPGGRQRDPRRRLRQGRPAAL